MSDKVLHAAPIHYFVDETWEKVQATLYQDGTFTITKRSGGKRPSEPITTTLTQTSKIKGPQIVDDKAVFVLKTPSTTFQLCAPPEKAQVWTDHLQRWINGDTSDGASSPTSASGKLSKKASSSNNLKSILKRGKRTAGSPEVSDREPKNTAEKTNPASTGGPESPQGAMARRASMNNLMTWGGSDKKRTSSVSRSATGNEASHTSSSGPSLQPVKEIGRMKSSLFKGGKNLVGGVVGGVMGGVNRVGAGLPQGRTSVGSSSAKVKKVKPTNEPDGTDQPLSIVPKVTAVIFQDPADIPPLSQSESSEEQATVQIEKPTVPRPTSVMLSLSDVHQPKASKESKKLDSDHQTKRKYIVVEILQTEKTYCNNLMVCVKSYWEPLIACCEEIGETKESINKIFGPPNALTMIRGFSSSYLITQLEAIVNAWGPASKLGAIFLKLAPFFKTYKSYSNTYGECMEYYEQKLRTNKLFAAKVDELRSLSGQHSSIPDILITPIQRLPRYSLLLQDLIKNTPEDHCDYAELSEAVKSMADAANYLNDTLKEYEKEKEANSYFESMEEKGIPCKQFLNGARHLTKSGVLKVQVQPLERWGKHNKETQHFILFTDIFVHVKKDTIFSKQGSELGKTLFNLPLTLVWIDCVKNNQWAIVTPHETLILPPEAGEEWGAQFTQGINEQLKHKNKLIPKNKQQYTFEIRKGTYEFPYHQGAYNGFWHSGQRHGRGRWNLTPLIWVRGHWNQGLVQGRAQASFLSKAFFDGNWSSGVQDGLGELTWGCGSKYKGAWANGERNGVGKLIFQDGSYYIGDWVDGRMEGTGKYEHGTGLPRYQGAWKENVFHGIGKLEMSNGSIYEGYFYMGQRYGRGVQTFPNKVKIIGDFVNGKLNGNGKITYPDGSYYEGQWTSGAPNGRGIKQWADKSLYDGNWVAGYRQGQGKHITPEGVTYEGSWFQDHPNGEGEIKDSKNGSSYKGAWVSGFGEGKGEYFFSGGSYVGHFLAGKFHKSGTLHSELKYDEGPQTLLYDGEWEKGRMTGKALIKFKNGDQHKGEYDMSLYEGKCTTTFANGSFATSKMKGGRRIAKGSMTDAEGHTFIGNITPDAPNTLKPEEGKGCLLPLTPLWPVFPMVFDADSWRSNKQF